MAFAVDHRVETEPFGGDVGGRLDHTDGIPVGEDESELRLVGFVRPEDVNILEALVQLSLAVSGDRGVGRQKRRHAFGNKARLRRVRATASAGASCTSAGMGWGGRMVQHPDGNGRDSEGDKR